MKNAIETFTNSETGISAFVHASTDVGYNVTVRDDDSGEFFPVAYVKLPLSSAISKAKEVLD